MERIELIVESEKMPRKEPERNCKCMNEPVDLAINKGILIWLKKEGDLVKKGELVCEGEVDKKVVEFFAPCDGVLAEQCVKDKEVFTAGMVLGHIESDAGFAK